jgi:hypothetical protein
MKERSPFSVSGPTLRCNKCHKLGNTNARCLSSNKVPSANVREGLNFTREEREVRNVGRDRPTNCFNCGRGAHVARIFQQGPAYRKCGLRGHTAEWIGRCNCDPVRPHVTVSNDAILNEGGRTTALPLVGAHPDQGLLWGAVFGHLLVVLPGNISLLV